MWLILAHSCATSADCRWKVLQSHLKHTGTIVPSILLGAEASDWDSTGDGVLAAVSDPVSDVPSAPRVHDVLFTTGAPA